MSARAQIVVVLFCVAILLLVFDLLRRRKMGEEYGLFWISILAGIIFFVSATPVLLRVTSFMGAMYPVSTLTLLSLVFLLIMMIYFSTKVSRLSKQVKEITQHLALMKLDTPNLGTEKIKPGQSQEENEER